MSLFSVILAIDTHGHTAAVFEPEQEHTETCPEEGPCGCPVVGYDLLNFGGAKTQSEREGYAQQAAEAAGGGHEEDCDPNEDTGECECDTSPMLPVLVATAESPDLVTWGRWLAELEHVQVDNFVEVPLTRLFSRVGNADDMALQQIVGLPPVGREVAFVLYMGQWAQTAPEAFTAIQPDVAGAAE